MNLKTRKLRWFNEFGTGDGFHEYGVGFTDADGKETIVTYKGLPDDKAEALQDLLARAPALLEESSKREPKGKPAAHEREEERCLPK